MSPKECPSSCWVLDSRETVKKEKLKKIGKKNFESRLSRKRLVAVAEKMIMETNKKKKRKSYENKSNKEETRQQQNRDINEKKNWDYEVDGEERRQQQSQLK